jgi:hypothetical protein
LTEIKLIFESARGQTPLGSFQDERNSGNSGFAGLYQIFTLQVPRTQRITRLLVSGKTPIEAV